RSFPDASRTPRRNSAHSVLHAFHALLHKASAAPLDANDSTGDISLMPKAISSDISAQVPSLACSPRLSFPRDRPRAVTTTRPTTYNTGNYEGCWACILPLSTDQSARRRPWRNTATQPLPSNVRARGMIAKSYNVPLVVLSIVVAMLGTYAAVEIAQRVRATEGRRRERWIYSGALAMGLGI